MTERAVFQFMDQHRNVLQGEHRFHVKQEKTRLLFQFEDVSEKAELAQQRLLGHFIALAKQN